MYTVPSEFYFRLHHPRPRFKNDVENVLGYVAFCIAQIGRRDNEEFKNLLRDGIRRYGGNAGVAQKTIENWRTEIGALFAMYIEGDVHSSPTQLSIDLADTSDLPAFFRGFVFSFQYPSGCLKPQVIGEMLAAGISYSPCRWLFNLLLKTDVGSIDKSELCHCAFNDMRVTRDHEPYDVTAARILHNRRNSVSYDSSGDVVRYAGDILDYCALAELLVECGDGRFTIDERNRDIVELFARSDVFFHGYESVRPSELKRIRALEPSWFTHVDRSYQDQKLMVMRVHEVRRGARAIEDSQTVAVRTPPKATNATTDAANHVTGNTNGIDGVDVTQIGNCGENLVWQHECLRLENEGRPDLVHLIKRIPTNLAVGYDVKSIEADTEHDRLIEVKTTKSQKPLLFNQIHLTPNEWRAAQSSGSRYCIYRLRISKDGYRLFVIRNPAQKLRDGLISFVPRDGMDICFSKEAGEEVELLCVH